MGGFPRFTGGFVELMNVPFIPVMIGLFAASEAFRSMEQNQQIRQGAKVAIGSLLLPWQTLRRIALTILRSSGLGVFIGMIPARGRILQLLLPITKLVVSVRHQKTLVRVKLKLWPPVRQARMAAPVAHCYLADAGDPWRCGNRHHAGRVNVTGNATRPADVYRPRRYGLYTVCRHDLLLLHATSSWTAYSLKSHR